MSSDSRHLKPTSPSPPVKPTRWSYRWAAFAILLVLGFAGFLVQFLKLSKFGSDSLANSNRSAPTLPGSPLNRATSDLSRVQDADLSLLFVGNSHTYMHDLPNITSSLIQSLHPSIDVYVHSVRVSFLEDLLHDGSGVDELKSRPWDVVILQAQKISSSGRVEYSTSEGISLAKLAREHGSRVLFYSEWGLKNVHDSTNRTEDIYRSMAIAADAELIPVGRVWEQVLASDPKLPLYSGDGNHQSRFGADLTAMTIAQYVLQVSAEAFADAPPPSQTAAHWKLFCEKAALVWQERSVVVP